MGYLRDGMWKKNLLLLAALVAGVGVTVALVWFDHKHGGNSCHLRCFNHAVHTVPATR